MCADLIILTENLLTQKSAQIQTRRLMYLHKKALKYRHAEQSTCTKKRSNTDTQVNFLTQKTAYKQAE